MIIQSEVDLQCQKLMEKLPNLHILENATVTIEGVRFAGTTLWFPKSSAESIGKQMMADFSAIYEFSPWVYERYAEAVQFLQNHADADVVITHHLPSNQSVLPQFRDSSLDAFFVAPVEGLIHSHCPTYWIHGHTHAHVDYQLGETRILANPLGYPYENPKITRFNPHMAISCR
jgi:Icc-related predicted phosphoesterase